MDFLGSDHVVHEQRRDVTIEIVVCVLSVPRLCIEIPRITEAVEKRIGTSSVKFGAVSEL
jgi:hypothetical protein